MAVQRIEIGGKSRPILFGNAAFRLRKQRTGKTMMQFFSDLSNTEEPDVIFDAVADITYCALKIGERAEKVQELDEYDEMEVSIWIDQLPGGIEKLSAMIVDSMPKPSAGEGEEEPGEAQKIGTSTS